jgi:hypothetical protein
VLIVAQFDPGTGLPWYQDAKSLARRGKRILMWTFDKGVDIDKPGL